MLRARTQHGGFWPRKAPPITSLGVFSGACLEWPQGSHIITLSPDSIGQESAKFGPLGQIQQTASICSSFIGTQLYPLVHGLSVAAITPELSIVMEAIWLIFKKNTVFYRKSFPHNFKVP